MDEPTFEELVLMMRKTQSKYFKAPVGEEKQALLSQSRKLERQVDKHLQEWKEKRDAGQEELF